jgi:hypothetical protein
MSVCPQVKILVATHALHADCLLDSRFGGLGRGQAPYLWRILVPEEQKENALTLLSGRIAANAGYADAGLKPLKPEQRKMFWIAMQL